MKKTSPKNKLFNLLMLTVLCILIIKGSSIGQDDLDLDAPVPSITIEEESGKTTSFGSELDFGDEEVTSTEENTKVEEISELEIPAKEISETNNNSPASSEQITLENEEGKVVNEAEDNSGGWEDSFTKTEDESSDSVSKSKTNKEEIETKVEESDSSELVVSGSADTESDGKLERLMSEANAPTKKTETPKESTPSQNIKEPKKEPKTKVVSKPESKPESKTASSTETPVTKEKQSTTKKVDSIVAAPEAPTPPEPEATKTLDKMEPPVIAEEKDRDEENPDLADLPVGTLPDENSEEMNREVEIARLIRQLEEEAASKEVAKSSLVPNQLQDEINFDNVPLGAAFRLLAEQAGFNFVEPNLPEGEMLSLRFQKIRPLDAFMKIAQARGFAVVTENGFTTLKRPDLVTPEFLEVKKYKLKFIQPKWVVQSIANLLEINIERPEDVIRTFPSPNEDASTYGGSNNGNSGGGGGTSNGGNGGASANGSQNIGLPTAPRWTSSLPYDEPLWVGENDEGMEMPYVFIDRTTSSLVVKTTKEKQKMVAQYLANVDTPEPQIMIETKVVEISVGDLLEYGTDWADALGKGITVEWKGAKINLNELLTGGGTGTWSAFLTIPETSVTLKAFQEMDNGSVMNMPRTMTRSGVPVSISSTITDATPAYQISTSAGGTGAVSTPSGFNTFTTGLTIDVVPQILEDGMIDVNINPTVANQIGERTIDANTQTGTPKQTIPIISSRSLTTSAIVPSGMTIMLGGIVETKKTDSSGGIPILSRVPILGKTIFGNVNKTDSRKTLIVFVTPKVIYPNEYQKVWTNEEEWRAMIDGNRIDIQTEKSNIPAPLEIRKALPVQNTLKQKPARQNNSK